MRAMAATATGPDGGTGRCLCGAVRYRFDGPPAWMAHCHCESCRRATAAPFTSFLGVRRDRLRWTGERAVFASSPGVTRSFCPRCGTPLSYETAERPQETDLYAATLDDPAAYAPAGHDHWNEHLPWLRLADGLPRILAPRRLGPADDMAPVLALIRDAFAFMAGRIDPPSSAGALTAPSLAALAADAELWVMEDDGATVACMILTPRPGCLYLGKLAVAAARRREGHARRMIGHAEARARALGLPVLELQTRVELTENHEAFRAMGFAEAGRSAHPGYDRPTTVTFRRPVPPAPAP